MKYFCLIATFAISFVITIGVRITNAVNAPMSDRILVSLQADQTPPPPILMKLQWGGYYTSQNRSGEWEVFRLIDILPDSCHIISYAETFSQMPTINNLLYLIPEEEVKSISGRELLLGKPAYLGRRVFKPGDLDNYVRFLNQKRHSGSSINHLVNRVITFSQGEPVMTEISLIDNKIDIQPEEG